MEVLDEPVQAPCDHLVCKNCTQNWLDQGKTSCPVDYFKNKIMELQVALTLKQTTINDKEKLIKEHEETISHLKSSIDGINSAMEASSFTSSAPPVELLKSMSIAPKCSDLVNQDSLQGIRSICTCVLSNPEEKKGCV